MTEAIRSDRVIETAGGTFLDPIDIDPRLFCLNDIGHALANMCRFNGHTSRHYSVAEHCLYMEDVLGLWGCSREEILTGLMHDASEAYLPDLASPLKASKWGARFREAEDRIMGLMSERFWFVWPMQKIVMHADRVLLWCEAAALMPSEGKTWPRYEESGKLIIETNRRVCSWISAGVRNNRRLGSIWSTRAKTMGAKV